ncbi:hypothetical protein ESOMN_v1c02340 [Williamsoniiplasma somnilux]|uniref:Serine aminopeptidase S33 domain-containing protein n=1 Tax=Williamsoniiplasma somnilux TaxID=215578 RepID=A0A2K8NZH5_9MOLU|nr:alpha/beta hydrolase [Williamsoniiplasma somnilux]ATZ18618.1 hypothetical protein ESOMN_v1c02340 [Williamsoniiplasma somnilux]
MDMQSVLKIVQIILSVIITSLIVLLLSVLFYKLKNLYSLKFKAELKQKSEFIDNKFFITDDQYQLHLLGSLKSTAKNIFIGVHELGMNKEDFTDFEKFFKDDENNAFICFDQRNFGQNIPEQSPSFSSVLFDLNNMINIIKEKYSQSKIILIGEGFGYYLALYAGWKNVNVSSIVALGPITRMPYNYGAADRAKIFSSWFFSHNRLIPVLMKGIDSSNNQVFVNEIDTNMMTKGFITTRQYYQLKRISKISLKKMKSMNIQQLIIQPKNDVYLNYEKLQQLIQKTILTNLKIVYIENAKHFILKENMNQLAFEEIKKWATK